MAGSPMIDRSVTKEVRLEICELVAVGGFFSAMVWRLSPVHAE